MYRFRDIYVYVMYYVYVTSGPSLLIESTNSMIVTHSFAIDWAYILSVASFLDLLVSDLIYSVLLFVDDDNAV